MVRSICALVLLAFALRADAQLVVRFSQDVTGTLALRSEADSAQQREVAVVDGRATIAEAAGSRWRAELVSDAWWMPAADIIVPATSAEMQVRAWPLARVSGRFRVAEGAQMPAKARVVVQSPPTVVTQLEIARNTPFECPVDATTGKWTCGIPAVTLDLTIGASGFVPHYRWSVDIAKTTDFGIFALRKGGSVVAWLAKEHRNAKARATLEHMVAADPSPAAQRLNVPVASASFDDTGFVQLAPIPAGRYILKVSGEGSSDVRIPLEVYDGRESALRRAITLEPAMRVTLAISPPRGPNDAPWQATVFRAGELSPAYEAKPVFHGQVPESGNVTIENQSAGRYRISVQDADGNRWASEEHVVHGSADANLPVTIDALAVTGKVRYGTTPLAARLRFGGADGAIRIAMIADAEGAFGGMLPKSGTWIVDVASTDGQLTTTTTVDVAKDERLDIVIPHTRVSGMVIDGRGLPAKQARVIMAGTGVVLKATTDDEGRFSFSGAREGEYGLSASDRTTGEASRNVMIDVAASAERSDIRLQLDPNGAISGRIVSRGRAVVGAKVFALARDVEYGEVSSGVTDINGAFRVDMAASAKRVLLVVLPPMLALRAVERNVESEIVVDVGEAGGTLDLRLPRSATRVLLFQDDAMLPLPLAITWARGLGQPLTDPSAIRIPAAAAGAYRVCAAGADAQEHCASGALAPGAVLTLDLTE